MKNLIKKWWFMLALLLIIIAGYSSFSYFKQDSKFSFRSLFIDSRTHTYQQDQAFKYGSYLFYIKPATISEITPMPFDCSTLCDDYKYNCEGQGLKSGCIKFNNEAKQNDYLHLTVEIKNISKNIHSFDKTGLKISGANGHKYDITDELSFDKSFNTDVTSDILPGQKRSVTFSTIQVGKGIKDLNLIISLPNLAPQIVNLHLK